MRVVIQRVSSASVSIDGIAKAKINQGLLILLGIENEDTIEDSSWLIKKIINLRIFNDVDEKMNLSLADVQGDVIIVSQFTLHASTKKGNRPSYIKAARPEIAIPLYEDFIKGFESQLGKEVGSGSFGAMMEVELINDGPVTISIDTKNRE